VEDYYTVKQGLSREEMFGDLDICLRSRIHDMIKTVLDEEINAYLASRRNDVLPDGKPAIVRNGYHAHREVTCLSGTVDVRVPRTRNRKNEKENFISSLIPPYMRRTLTIDQAVPLLYLRGLSNGDFMPSLRALFGNKIKGLSPSNITRLKHTWREEYATWKRRDLSGKRYCYVWVDGIYVNVRFSKDRLCILVAIGALEDGTKEVLAVESGYRESAESWRVLLRDLKERGLKAPLLFIGDGNLGFWKALRHIYPTSRRQRCWAHKIANVLDKLPKSVQGKAKQMLHEIYKAPNKETAVKSFDAFLAVFEAKYPRAAECVQKDREALLTFYDFPAEHWKHIRTTNVIESTFSTVRLRTKKTRGQGTEETTLLMVYKLIDQASERWQRLNGRELITKIINGVKFVNGEEDKNDAA
jgi:transposase-like protein